MKHCVLYLLLAASACHSFRDPSVIDETSRSIPTLDTAHFTMEVIKSRHSVRHFYERRTYALKWIDEGSRLTAAADSMINFVNQVDRMGLLPDDYHALLISDADSFALTDPSRLDVLLTDAYLTLYHELQHGRLDPKTHDLVDRSFALDVDAIAALEATPAASMTDQLSKRQPAIRQYTELRDALANLSAASDDSSQQQRATIIRLNMERWKWRKKIHDRYVSVNIPAFLMRVVEQDSIWLETRVIVGKPETPTPVMESVIRSFIIYPYWHVPKSISTKEILPQLQADASYLSKNNFDVLDRTGKVILSDTIKWDRYSVGNFPFVLRQREGSENSMGIIKFIFANNYGVYLHDTNSKRLYSQVKRDLSHGCVRVSKAVAFAHYLVREDDIYVSPEDLDQYLSLQQRLTIQLRKPIPVLLEYFTAEVVNGKVVFYDDVYKRDSVMIRRLYPHVNDVKPTPHSPAL